MFQRHATLVVSPLVQRDGLGEAPCRLVGAGEVVARGQGVGVLVAQDVFAVGEGPLVQRDGLLEARSCASVDRHLLRRRADRPVAGSPQVWLSLDIRPGEYFQTGGPSEDNGFSTVS